KTLLFYFFALNLTIFSQHQFDTLSIKQVAKGVFHYSVHEPNVPWTLDILKIDLQEEIIKIEAGISKDKITGFEKTSAMSARYNSEGHHIVGAINGGFFDGNGQDVGMQIREGEIITQNNNWSTIGFSSDKEPFIERLSLSSKLILSDKTSKNINGINKTRETDFLILFNSYFGTTTGTNQYGSEILVEPISKIQVNDTVKYIVVDKKVGQGSMALSKGKVVLSGHGTSKDFIDSLISIGDTISVIQKISPAPENIVTLLNGYPKIVSNGENCALACYVEEGGSNTFASARHPRTAAGFSEDKRYLYLVTVDGRQTTSNGMSLPELADFLVNFGVYRAVNMDGGGSTTMVVRNSIVNSPSDAGGERSVSNSLMVVSLDNKSSLSKINLNTKYAKVFSAKNYQFNASGTDEFFNPITITTANVNYSLSHNFGSISTTGLFTAGGKADTGYVIAEYDGLLDSSLVIVNSIVKLQISPEVLFADTTNSVQFSVKAFDVFGFDQKLSTNNFNWTSTNTNVGTIDSLGKFTGISEGTTKIIVIWNEISDTAIVTISMKNGTSILNSFETLDNWSFSGENIDTSKSNIEIANSHFTEGNSSVKLNYNFVYQSGVQNWAYLNTNIPIEGIPLNFGLDANGNDFKHSIAFIVTNYSGEEFAILADKQLDVDEHFDTLKAKFSKPIPLVATNVFHFPITLTRIAVILASGRVVNTNYSGSIFFDNLTANYSEPTVSVEENNNLVSEFRLDQNFPNPFNPTTTIQYAIPQNAKNNYTQPITLKIYNILGQEIATLVNKEQNAGNYSVQFDARNLASGVYYYTLKSGTYTQSKKMLLLR
ncbi:MAG: phosphodiester glycosidase family protein, partial [Bacteroidetes bacterium]|nr:phosphodiester glycosidase family protein [Bacteroidota bacterium]